MARQQRRKDWRLGIWPRERTGSLSAAGTVGVAGTVGAAGVSVQLECR